MSGVMWLMLERGALMALEIVLAVPALYLAVVTLAALWASWRHAASRAKPAAAISEWPRVVMLIPAHNEERLIGRLLTSVSGLSYPRDHLAVYVIADNCTDATAALASAFTGVQVLTRTDSTRASKGYALEWALDWLKGHDITFDACVMFDADSVIDPDCLRALAVEYLRGADAVQGQYIVLNAFDSPPTSLRWLALTLMNHVRQLGRATLGASCSLMGNGMLFRAALLERRPWRAFGQTEDYQYYLDLVENGELVRYAAGAVVKADMPKTFAQMRPQDLRWDSDPEEPTLVIVARLLRAAVRWRSAIPLEAIIELVTPPLSLLASLACVLLVAAVALGWPLTLIAALCICACVVVYISSALLLERPPLRFYGHLAYAPFYLCWKLWVKLIAVRLPHRSREWVRTSRVG